MPKESNIAKSSPRHTHRTYTREFKAELVAACQQPGASIAGLASSHAMNANVLHRWLKEHARDGRHQLGGTRLPGAVAATAHAPAFIPIQLPAVMHESRVAELKVELRKGALSMTVTWPLSAMADFAQWTQSILK
ncbi:MAG: transposase [Pseudomonadota bacterium]